MPYQSSHDLFANRLSSPQAPARIAIAVTPDDMTDFAPYPKALYLGVAGDIALVPLRAADDTPVIFRNHPAGYLPLQVRRVLATGTTASQILALLD